MKFKWISLAIVGFALLIAPLTSMAELIAVEDFAKHAAFRNIKISPDGEHLAFSYRDETQVNLAVMNIKSKKITGKFEFGEWYQVSNFHWANNKRVIMEVQKFVGYLDKKGSATDIYAANIDGKHRKRLFTSGNAGYQIVSMLEAEDDYILLIKGHGNDYDREDETMDVNAIKLNINTARTNKLGGHPKQQVSNILFDKHDQMRIATRYVTDKERFGWGTYEIYLKNEHGGWIESNLSQYTDKRISFRGLSADGNNALVVSDMGGEKTSALYRVNLQSGKYEKVFEDNIVDLGGVVRAYDKAIIGVNYSPNYNVTKFFDTEHPEAKALAALYTAFPGSDVTFTSYTRNGEKATVFVRSDTNPGDFYLFDFADNSLKYLMSTMPWIKPEQMAKVQPIEYTTRDGVKIQGYLTLPQGKSENLPLIIHPHGGPHGPRDFWGFDPDVQFMANRGYAVLQMNFRGSGGYGKEFESSGYRKWGREMQDDVTDATLWAIKSGVADPERICIYGGSYGGYATLMGVVKEPDLYKCGLGYVGVYDLETMYEAGDIIQRESGIRYLKHVLGEDKEELRANSPARNVSKIKADLFIAHGEEDVRVPMEQYDVLIEALDKAKIPYQSMVKDEGHGYQKFKNRVEFYQAMEKFFAKNLK